MRSSTVIGLYGAALTGLAAIGLAGRGFAAECSRYELGAYPLTAELLRVVDGPVGLLFGGAAWFGGLLLVGGVPLRSAVSRQLGAGLAFLVLMSEFARANLSRAVRCGSETSSMFGSADPALAALLGGLFVLLPALVVALIAGYAARSARPPSGEPGVFDVLADSERLPALNAATAALCCIAFAFSADLGVILAVGAGVIAAASVYRASPGTADDHVLKGVLCGGVSGVRINRRALCAAHWGVGLTSV